MTDAADPATTPLTPAERDFLGAHDGPASASVRDRRESVRRAERGAWHELLDRSLTVEQVAEMLHVTGAEVQVSVDEGRLYCFSHQGAQHFPDWQFSGGKPLPHLYEVLMALEGIHPATVGGFMTVENDELAGLSPARWLISGRPVQRVVVLAGGLLIW